MDAYYRNTERDMESGWREGNSWETEFSAAPCEGIIHVIRPGDTLYRLSRIYHVRLEEIMYRNPYVNIYNLQVGDELCIPVTRVRNDREDGNMNIL